MGWPGPGKVAPPGGAPGNLPPSIGCPPPSLQHPCPLLSSISSGHSMDVKMCELYSGSSTHLEKVSGVTRGGLLSCSMASCGEGAGKGSTRLGGLPGLTVRHRHQTNTGPGTNTRSNTTMCLLKIFISVSISKLKNSRNKCSVGFCEELLFFFDLQSFYCSF